MSASTLEVEFFVWGIDQNAYGPVELPSLVSWVKDERVLPDTWVFVGKTGAWQKASEIPELQMFFGKKKGAAAVLGGGGSERGVDIRALRRIKIMAGFTDEQLERLARFVAVERIPQWATVVKQGDPGDSMYFVFEGELRVRMDVMGRETILATLTAGEFFGDISLFDHGPRSADVVANVDSVVGRFSVGAFDELSREAPELATPLLRAIGRTLTSRIRADNKRYSDSVKIGRVSI